MANPQIENGYTMIANELLEALGYLHLPTNEWQIVMVIIRKTYGYKKKVDKIANFQIVAATGLRKDVVSRAIKNLEKKQIIIRFGKIIGINKNYSQWKLAELQTVKLAELQTELAKLQTKVGSPHVTQKKKENIQKKEYININKKNNKDMIDVSDPDKFIKGKYGQVVKR